jgi:3-oxoacyl-(acyl-carrier-protein) synthase
VYPIKGAVGECMGAGGAAQVAAALFVMEGRCVPPAAGLYMLDPTIAPVRVPTSAIRVMVNRVMVVSLDEGGHASVLLLRRAEP